jgi:hypothetical protein
MLTTPKPDKSHRRIPRNCCSQTGLRSQADETADDGAVSGLIKTAKLWARTSEKAGRTYLTGRWGGGGRGRGAWPGLAGHHPIFNQPEIG